MKRTSFPDNLILHEAFLVLLNVLLKALYKDVCVHCQNNYRGSASIRV